MRDVNFKKEGDMDVQMLKDVFFRCFLYGMILLLIWFLMYLLLGDWIYSVHSSIFDLSRRHFDKMHYSGMVRLKMTIFVFFLIPYLAVTVSTRKRGK